MIERKNEKKKDESGRRIKKNPKIRKTFVNRENNKLKKEEEE